MKDVFSELTEKSSGAVRYIIGEITKICRDMDKRAPGSEGEIKAGEYMADVLEKECGCKVKREYFELRPGAFYGYLYFSAALNVLCSLTFFIHPALSIVFGFLTLLLFTVQFIFYVPVVDPFFKKGRSINVTAVKPCRGEIKRRLFINGHIDAAWEWPVNYWLGGVAFEAHGVIAVAGVLFYIVISIMALCGSNVRTAALAGLAFIPFWIGLCFMSSSRRVVDGANDNLTGCYMGIALMKAMKEQGIELEGTELCVLLTGSEEAGLKGAKAWVKAHAQDYKDVPSYIYGFDTIHDPKFLMTNERDLNWTMATDKELAGLFVKSAGQAGVSCIRGAVPPMGGSTDCSAFTKGGFRAVCITGLDHKLEDYYHTRRDTWDNLNEKGLSDCWKALAKLVENIDAGCLEGGGQTQEDNNGK